MKYIIAYDGGGTKTRMNVNTYPELFIIIAPLYLFEFFFNLYSCPLGLQHNKDHHLKKQLTRSRDNLENMMSCKSG